MFLALFGASLRCRAEGFGGFRVRICVSLLGESAGIKCAAQEKGTLTVEMLHSWAELLRFLAVPVFPSGPP